MLQAETIPYCIAKGLTSNPGVLLQYRNALHETMQGLPAAPSNGIKVTASTADPQFCNYLDAHAQEYQLYKQNMYEQQKIDAARAQANNVQYQTIMQQSAIIQSRALCSVYGTC